MATAAAALPGTFNFQGLPGELRNAIFLQAHRDRRNYVMHHYFLVQRDVTVGRSLRRYYSMPRCYVCVNPFGRSINDNTPVTRHAPIFRGIPGSNVDGHFLSWRKIELPRGAHFKRATMTYATRNVRAQFAASEHRPPGEKYIYVDWFQDVFVFHNVYGYPPYSAPPADVSSDRQNQFQFLSDNLSRGVNQNVGYTAGGGHLNWVTNVRKAGVIIHDHFYPVTPAPLRDGYTQWILTIVNNVIDRFQSLQRLYLIIDAWDPACALLAGDRRDLDTGRRQTLDSDGFVDYFRFLRSHRSAIHHSGTPSYGTIWRPRLRVPGSWEMLRWYAFDRNGWS
ncbi:hypothetical protein TruAng_005159 [Truncatella angustata]|nr:hypothetical protein TruAng_005159 [Truncatella angustata]